MADPLPLCRAEGALRHWTAVKEGAGPDGRCPGGLRLIAEVAPKEGDVLLPKKHPSAFFGTPFAGL